MVLLCNIIKKVDMKKFKTPIIPLIIATLCGILLPILLHPATLLYFANKWAYNAEFDDYKSDFIIVADYCRDIFENGSSEAKSSDQISYEYDQKGGYYLYYNSERLSLPEDVQKSVNSIHNAFTYKHSVLGSIRYDPGRISFRINSGKYALVYSFDDEKPKFLDFPDEEKKIYVKKIEKNWYHVRGSD